MKIFIRLIVVLLLGTLAAPALADYDVTITSGASTGGAWSGASPDVWTPSAIGATVSVADILTRLATKGVTITTAGGGADNGDITFSTPLSWSANTLEVTATRDVQINAVMSATNTAALTMATTSGTVRTGFASGGGFAGRVDFFQADGTTPRSGSGFLTINGSGYTVITSLGAQGSTTGTDLQGISGNLAGRYALGANIDASATSGWNSGADSGFVPLGNYMTRFTGVFDGLGHTVSGFIAQKNSTISVLAGLFGYSDVGAALRNVGLVNGFVYGSSTSIVTYSGGLVGYNGGSISNCYSTAPVIGSNNGGNESDSGGLVGINTGSISNSYSTAPVIGSTSSNNSGRNYSGGLVGKNAGSISNSYSTAPVTGSSSMNSYTFSGGLVGSNNGSISNSYSTGSVSSGSGNWNFSSGLVGNNGGSISNSYSTGSVTGFGLNNVSSGLASSGGSISASFWDIEASAMATSAAGTGKTTAAMKSSATFSGWDISEAAGSTSVWRIVDGVTYPLLRLFSQFDVYALKCSPGNFDNGTACTPCAAGSYQSAGSQTACIPAPIGSFAAAGATAPTACSPGEFQSIIGQSSCYQCPAGKYQPLSGQAVCFDAQAGYFITSQGSATPPTACPAGTFQAGTGQSSCQSCPAGTLQPATGQTACVAIPKAVNSVTFDPLNLQKLYSGIDNAGVYFSANGGSSWIPATTQPTNNRVKALVLMPGNAAQQYAATYGGGLFKSVNSGVDWAACTTQPANLNLVSLTIDANGKLYAGTEGGVFVSTDGCGTWTALNGGLP